MPPDLSRCWGVKAHYVVHKSQSYLMPQYVKISGYASEYNYTVTESTLGGD